MPTKAHKRSVFAALPPEGPAETIFAVVTPVLYGGFKIGQQFITNLQIEAAEAAAAAAEDRIRRRAPPRETTKDTVERKLNEAPAREEREEQVAGTGT